MRWLDECHHAIHWGNNLRVDLFRVKNLGYLILLAIMVTLAVGLMLFMNLLEVIEAGKNAVLAITDEASEAFAAQSRQAADGVESSLKEIESIIHQDRCEFIRADFAIVSLCRTVIKANNY